MTSRMEILDLIDRALSEKLGMEKISRRSDGVIIVAGTSEAFAVQAMTIDAPDGADPFVFGEELVEFIRSKAGNGHAAEWPTNLDMSPGHEEGQLGELVFYSSSNGDKWALVTDVGGRRFVRHTPTHRSGGQLSITDLDAFLQREQNSPQNQALQIMLATKKVK